MADLFGPPPLEQWPADLRYLFHERACIKEFDGGLSRYEAEAQALAEVWDARNA